MSNFDNAVIKDNTLYPKETVQYYDEPWFYFKPDELKEPLEAACRDVIKNAYLNEDKDRARKAFLDYLGLKALIIQARELGYTVKSIDWQWWANKQLSTNFYIKVQRKNEPQQSWQVYSYEWYSQFLLLEAKYYNENGYYNNSNAYNDDLKYSRIFMQRIRIGNKDQYNSLLSDLKSHNDPSCFESYLSNLSISYGEARYITMEQLASEIIQQDKIAPIGTILKAKNIENEKDDNLPSKKPKKLEDERYYASMEDMTRFNE